MNKINDIEIKRDNRPDTLPAGGYVVKILNVEEKKYDWGSKLEFSFDIAEGEHAEHFRQMWSADTREDKKWKGVYRLTVPDEKNQYYVSQKRTFGNAFACIEESNKGYRWDWDEHKLKDKLVGVLFRDREWEYEDKTGWTTEAFCFVPVEEIRKGQFKTPAPKPLKKDTAVDNSMFTDVKKLEDELPF